MSKLTIQNRTFNVDAVSFPIKGTPRNNDELFHSVDGNLREFLPYFCPEPIPPTELDKKPRNVFLTDGERVYVASKRGLPVKHFRENDTAFLDGKPMRVWQVNRTLDSRTELAAWKLLGLVWYGAATVADLFDHVTGRGR